MNDEPAPKNEACKTIQPRKVSRREWFSTAWAVIAGASAGGIAGGAGGVLLGDSQHRSDTPPTEPISHAERDKRFEANKPYIDAGMIGGVVAGGAIALHTVNHLENLAANKEKNEPSRTR